MIKYLRGDFVIKNFIMLNILITSTILNSLAPLMPVFQNKLSISISASSSIPVFGVLGTTIFSFIMSILISKFGIKKSNFFGYIFLFIGLLLFLISENLLGIIFASFFVGASSSILFTSLTTLLAHLDNPRFGLTHAFFGMGGIIAPFLVSLSVKSGFSYKYLYLAYFILMLLMFILNFFIKMPEAKYEIMRFDKLKITILKPVFYISIISFLIYSGSEIGLVTWVSNLFIHFGHSVPKSALSISMFWIFYTISRFLSDFIVKIVEEKKIIVFCSFLSAILIMTMILTKNSYVFLIVGLFMGAIFPVIQRYANMNLNKNEVGLLNGVTYGSTGIGGMIFSYFMGLISKKSIPLMFVLPIIGLILVGFLQLFERRRVNT